jgi:hypothetical protein
MKSLKAKFKSISPQDKERLKYAVSTAVSGLQTILGLAKEVAGSTGVPGLQAGIGGLLFVLDTIKVILIDTVSMPAP